jgi:hypothetical protein
MHRTSNQLFPCKSNCDQVHKSGFLGQFSPSSLSIFLNMKCPKNCTSKLALHHYFNPLNHATAPTSPCLEMIKTPHFDHTTQEKKNSHVQVFFSCCKSSLSTQSSKLRKVLNLPPSLESPLHNSTSTMSVTNTLTLFKHPNKLSKVI